jgi:hypothetical protein
MSVSLTKADHEDYILLLFGLKFLPLKWGVFSIALPAAVESNSIIQNLSKDLVDLPKVITLVPKHNKIIGFPL